MSYARFGWGGSDVYVYLSVTGHLECCACSLAEEDWGTASFDTTDDMVDHLMRHRAAGKLVPEHCIKGLRDDQEANDAFIEQKKESRGE